MEASDLAEAEVKRLAMDPDRIMALAQAYDRIAQLETGAALWEKLATKYALQRDHFLVNLPDDHRLVRRALELWPELAMKGTVNDDEVSSAVQPDWLTAEQIAARWDGVTAQRVGQVVTLIGLRDSKVHISHSPAAVGLIDRELKSRGYKRVTRETLGMSPLARVRHLSGGAPYWLCKKALARSNGDETKSLEWLRYQTSKRCGSHSPVVLHSPDYGAGYAAFLREDPPPPNPSADWQAGFDASKRHAAAVYGSDS